MVSKMIRKKSEYICSKCGGKSITFQGYCPKCNAAGTMEKKTYIPDKPVSRETIARKSLRRRSKTSEREVARGMVEADGPDPAYRNVTSSTGRVGHITGMQIDAISKNYVTENKNRLMPKWLIVAWIQILQRASDFDKEALLHLDPPNLPKDYLLNGIRRKTGTMALITQTRHKELIIAANQLSEIREIMLDGNALSAVSKVKKVRDILNLN